MYHPSSYNYNNNGGGAQQQLQCGGFYGGGGGDRFGDATFAATTAGGVERRAPAASATSKTCPSIALVIISALLLLTALILATVAVLDPSWLVVDIREFQSEHHHGLYTDCSRAERVPSGAQRRIAGDAGLSVGTAGNYERSPLHCTYKFDASAASNIQHQIRDIDTNGAAIEAEHHQFHGWHKAVLILIGLSIISGVLALFAGLCMPCAASWAVLHAVFSFFAFLFAICAAAIFFFAAHRVDERFVQGLVATYEQRIGEAFYCYLISTLMLLIVFILSLIGAYAATRSHAPECQRDEYRTSAGLAREQLAPLYAPSAAIWRGAV